MKQSAVPGWLVVGLCILGTPWPAAAQPQVQERGFVLGGSGSRIGVSIREVREADLSAAKLTRPEGVLVEAVESGSPAERAGLRASDIVVTYDGERVRGARHFARLVQETPPARAVQMTINRGGASQTLTVTPEEGRASAIDLDDIRERMERGMETLPFGLGQRAAERRLGLTLMPLSSQLAAYFGVSGGVLVSEVVADSPAARANVRAGDIVRMVNGRTVDSPAEVVRQLRDQGAGAMVDLTLLRDKQEVKVSLRLEDTRQPRRRSEVGI